MKKPQENSSLSIAERLDDLEQVVVEMIAERRAPAKSSSNDFLLLFAFLFGVYLGVELALYRRQRELRK